MDGSLFCPQAVEFQSSRSWAGTTAAPPPKSWWLAGFLAAVVAVSIVFLACGTYARKETVYGFVAPIGGVAKIMPPARGLGPVASNHLVYYVAAASFAGPLLLGRWFDKIGCKPMAPTGGGSLATSGRASP